MLIERFDPAADPELTSSCYQIYLDGLPLDDPAVPPMSALVFRGWLRYGWTEEPRECFLARDEAGRVTGWSKLGFPERENRHLALVDICVDPARRRQGIGAELVRHAADRTRRDGRRVLVSSARSGSPGLAFAAAIGCRTGLEEIRRLLEPGPVGPELRTRAAQALAGYSLVSWSGLTPARYLDGVARLNSTLADAPRDPGQDAQIWDADRVRGSDRRRQEQGMRTYAVAALARASGEMAGLTELEIDPGVPEWGFQAMTGVVSAHRGHRLGLALKIAMLDLLAELEPGIKWIVTGNANGNEHMIAINEALGFRELDRWPGLELDLDLDRSSGS